MKRFFLALSLLVSCFAARAQTPTSPSPTSTPLPAPTPFLTPTPKPASKTIPAATYRALLQSALDQIERIEKRPPSDVRSLLKPLDAPFVVKRADGQTQSVRGDEWNQILTGATGQTPAKLSREATRALKGSLQKRLRALDDWTTPRANGAYYTSVDAQKVVDEAVAKNQIRVGPPPLQKWIGDIQTAVITAIGNFFKWLGSLLPKAKTPSLTAKAPDLSWLWFVFWAIMLSLFGLLMFLAVRALSGGSFTLWGFGRRRKKTEVELRDEDAALFQLAPEELRDRADNFAAQGNFREALRHRFISLLVLLDARGTWRYDVRRTNWEHIAALRRDESKRPLVAPLSDLTRSFDRVRYGGATCDEEGWNSFQSGVRGIEAQVGGRAIAR